MRFRIYGLRFTIYAALVLLSAIALAGVEQTNTASPIDLPTALRLAGAQNLDVKLAREKLAEAKAAHTVAVEKFFPWIAPGVGYHRRDGLAQAVPAGTISEAHYQSYGAGGTLAAQLDLGDAIYQSLAAKQLVKAADHALDAQRQESTLAAATGYFDLALAQGGGGVAREAVRISADYEEQLARAVEVGIAFRGDQLRVQVQTERNRLVLRQAQEQQRLAAARLAQVLHLDPLVELAPQESDLAPLALVETNVALSSWVQQTFSLRPELKQSQALAAAAHATKQGAVYAPLIPSIGAQAFFGGFGGGPSGTGGTFGEQEDYWLGLSWRIGPGGLFDSGRRRAADSQRKIVEINTDKLRDDLSRQVVEAFTRWQSAADQVADARRALGAAEEGLRLARERKEFAVGVVLENIQAQQDLTRARLDYLKAVAELNKAQYALLRATGKL